MSGYPTYRDLTQLGTIIRASFQTHEEWKTSSWFFHGLFFEVCGSDRLPR